MRTLLLMLAVALTAAAAPAAAQQDSAAAADTTELPDTTAIPDTTEVPDTTAAAAPDAAAPRTVPSLEGYRKVAILSRDMLPGARGYETAVEVHRGPDGAQVLRFVTDGVPWALVVRPAGATDTYTLRDFDCSGAFSEALEAGTPLAVPDCAAQAESAPAPSDDN
jgi:hypothetical protein